MSPRLILLGAVALAACASLAGCGKVSELDRPRPMFGNPNDSALETDARHAAAVRARADAAQAGRGQDAPQSIEELRDYGLPAEHQREQPIQAAPGDPDASQPQQATPKPIPPQAPADPQ
jgi:hypothetical protein